MNLLSSFLVAVSTLAFAPSTGINYIPEPDPLPVLVVQQTEPPEVIEEVKPIPNTAPIVKESACNCYNILKETFGSVPPMDVLLASASTTSGNVAVFKYPATPEWPNGIPHVAIVHGVLPDGSIQIEEYNYHRCAHSYRTISPTDHRLVGFMNL